ncbi:lysine-specific demethylase ELF6 isoform X1 [Ziziphus jujuba]|uniref:Lysine-specific demethylase ELF6 isoform X1 n=1 Tax=Ziziphus jujuba TaxID=326968 RepID=A0ABM3ICG1_ZIZJJ|nr:lysine-specific demethylase ELF6 isoform X1 [Ziziphus jujuba]
MGNVEIPNWLEGLPLAPEFRPTDTEFADPIAYISKIEKEASAFGICKVIPPLPKPSKRYVFGNLNKSLAKCPDLGADVNSPNFCSSSKMGSFDGDGDSDGEVRAVFTTRHQELGQTVKRTKGVVQSTPLGVHKQVWQSGEIYTLEQFESKSRAFAKSHLGMVKEVSPLVIEAMFWKAASEKPIYIEYANDVPGSAFGEPEGHFRYIRRRRRQRNFYQRSRESSNRKKNEIVSNRNSIENSITGDVKDVSPNPENDSEQCLDASKSSTAISVLSSDETSRSSRQKSQSCCFEKEGTAGWKLSNSPWNLQVIARSSGSLTRFMPDDIPGVTSPMVYIGMLFSWFAWHVEDHELHSMNYLHTGSPKTWYAVPGDYAFAFEEIVRSEAYGVNIDRLAALTLLGEKTTLMSPEVVVASGIPCCRLIQNPGEFVVTFPRAYHVGFSHGFNCGEAANFGTPQWLKVAKEAAVRRAAMNYLPMLSHQQLLYLLTMSFVSRVPRSLLPGVRSSRLRDRQKEERELLVKKAFIEDILNENDTLNFLLGKDSSYRAVLWNPDLLPYPSKEPSLPSVGATVDPTLTENISHIHPAKDNNNQNHLLDEMSLYMENLNDLYLDGDDLSCDFQVDSGTLACVACGILGFPFMSVVQPSEKASLELLPNDQLLVQECPHVSVSMNSCSSPDLHSSGDASVTGNLLPILNSPSTAVLPSVVNFGNGWDTSNKFLRPRSFCLEHAVEIVELLQSRGGARILVICHSDYQKIKANAAAIAEEIGSPFSYKEVPLDIASKDELNLIDLAIDDEEHDECREDWTSKLGINLRNCVKIRKNSPSEQVQHALKLGGLFSEKIQMSDFSTIKWQLRRSRSKKSNHPMHRKHCEGNTIQRSNKPCERNEIKKDLVVGERSQDTIKKEVKLIQYSRKKFKKKLDGSTRESGVCRSPAMREDLHKHSKLATEDNFSNMGNSSSSGNSEKHNEIQMLEATRDESLGIFVGSVELQIKNCNLEKLNLDGKDCNLAEFDSSEIPVKMGASEGSSEKKSTNPFVHATTDKSFEIHQEKQIVAQLSTADGACSLASEGQSDIQANADILMNDVPDLAKIKSSNVVNSPEGTFEGANNEVYDCIISDNGVQQELNATNRSNNKEPVSCNSELINYPTLVSKECYEGPRENTPASTEGASKILTETCAAVRRDEEPDSNREDQQNFPTAVISEEELESSFSEQPQMEANPPFISAKDHPQVSRGSSGIEYFIDGKPPDSVENMTIATRELEPVFNLVIQTENGPTPVSVEEFEDQSTCAKDNLKGNLTSDNEQRKDHATTDNSGEETVSPPTVSTQKYSRSERENSDMGDLCNASEVCSSQDDRKLANIKCNTADPKSIMGKKRKREMEQLRENKSSCSSFIRSPCEGLRPRIAKDASSRSGIDYHEEVKEKLATKEKKSSSAPVAAKDKKQNSRKFHKCDLEGCRMSFDTKAELTIHKRNRCPHEGCGKRFSSHKYAMIHHRVHDDERPLKCPWKGCSMSFKWAWARTEHIRVHTGERPYQCKIEGCSLSFRFVSDFSRHRRKTGHYVN